ncbi:transposase [Bradyrhizobium sp. WSM 4400]|nr:transposase [Bradyrhizobium australafricanum]
MEGRQRRSFTDDYKRQAVDLVASSGRSIGSVAKELGLRDSVLRRWVEQRWARLEPTAATRRPTTQGDAAVGGPRGRDRAFAARERAAAHGARHFRKVDRDLCWNTDMRFRFMQIPGHRQTAGSFPSFQKGARDHGSNAASSTEAACSSASAASRPAAWTSKSDH